MKLSLSFMCLSCLVAAVCAVSSDNDALAPEEMRFQRMFASEDAEESGSDDSEEPVVSRPPTEAKQESDLDACVQNAFNFETHIRSDNVIDAQLPDMMAGWCSSILVSRKDLLPEGVTEKICAKGRTVYADSPHNPTEAVQRRNARLFCQIMRDDFAAALAKEVAKKEKAKPQDWSFERPLATRERDVTPNDDGAKAPCCKAHAGKGCFDKAISTCVCEIDDACCNKSWDLVCTEKVESTKCGRCPIE